jgi:hypothetical protein
MNRIDFFLNEREVAKLCEVLRRAGAPGYSVTRHVTGMGHGGEISEAMEFTDLGANSHVVVFCDGEVLTAVRKQVKPLLKRYGGVGFVSDAQPF